jgi:glycosyltransferase involved in cell wall biosynthesis
MTDNQCSPAVTVVMSVFNGAATIEECLRSTLSQSLRDLTAVVIDDGSTDETGEILQRIAANDSRIHVVRQPNRGITAALILGCAMARSPYIARQDADDLSAGTRLAKQVELLERDPHLGFASCFTQYIGPADEPLELVTRPLDPTEATTGLLYRYLGPPAHGSVMFRRSLYEQVGGYRPEFYYGQDADLWLRMAQRMQVGYVDEVLYFFRRHAGSISGSQRPLQTRFGELGQLCFQARLSGQPETPYLDEARELTARIRSNRERATPDRESQLEMSYLIGTQLVNRGDRRAREYLRQVLSQRPWHWKAWARMLQSFVPLGSVKCL